jgi:hypothetical protein
LSDLIGVRLLELGAAHRGEVDRLDTIGADQFDLGCSYVGGRCSPGGHSLLDR